MSAVVLPFKPRPSASSPQHQEVVASLLMLLEDAPLSAPAAFCGRDMTGKPFVGVRHAGVTLRLTPEDAHLAATALIAEQAFIGCVEAAFILRSAAEQADRSVATLHPRRDMQLVRVNRPRRTLLARLAELLLRLDRRVGAAG